MLQVCGTVSTLLKFVKPEVIACAKDMVAIKYDCRDNQKSRDDLVIGAATREYLDECKHSGEMISEDRNAFYGAAIKFFMNAMNYILAKFSLNDDALIHAQVADISCRGKAKCESVKYLVTHFPCMLPVQLMLPPWISGKWSSCGM